MIRLLLDQGLPRSAAAQLREQGVDTVHVGEVGMATALDITILDYATNEKRVCVTLDADFHAILVVNDLSQPSVIRFRIQGLRAEPLTKHLLRLCREFEETLLSGAMVTVTAGAIRVHRL